MFLHDLRLGMRSLWRAPGYSAVAILTLAAGIATSVAMFTVVQAVLLSPLPYEQPDRLVMLWNRYERTGAAKVQIAPPDMLDYRERSTTIAEFAALRNSSDATITGEETGAHINQNRVSTNFFDFLGTSMPLGRSFVPNDAEVLPATTAPVVISHSLWARRYGADPGMVGRTIEINGDRREVIGVLPGNFALILPEHDGGMLGGGALDEVDVWSPAPARWWSAPQRGYGVVRVLGRLADGATLSQARQEMDGIAEELRSEHAIHEQRGMAIDVLPLHADVVGEVRPAILALFGAVGVVLMIACANVANMSLVRGVRRAREIAVRAALGGNRVRIVRELVTESAIVALLAGVVGTLLATLVIRAIITITPSDVPRVEYVGVDIAALLFALATAGVAVLVSGLAPAVHASSADLASALKDGSIGSGNRRSATRDVVVVAEVALSMVLLVVGALLTQSFAHMVNAPLGFDATNTLTAKFALPSISRPHLELDLVRQQREEFQAAVGRLPGVEAVGFAWPVPFGGRSLEVPYADRQLSEGDWNAQVATRTYASPGLFAALGSRVIAGRGFNSSDVDLARQVRLQAQAAARAESQGSPSPSGSELRANAVIDERVAATLFPDVDPIGRVVWLGAGTSSESTAYLVIGVIEHLRHQTVVGDEREAVFVTGVPLNAALVARTSTEPTTHTTAIESQIREIDPLGTLYEARSMSAVVGEQLAGARFTASLAIVFAALAAGLAAIGLYGVIAHSVSQRTRDIGVRVALGATRGDVLRLVLRDGMGLVGAGVALGVVGAVGAGRLIASLLHGIGPGDAVTFIVVGLLLALATGVANYIPARRAARMDPLDALRSE